jgi:hypothetical protein
MAGNTWMVPGPGMHVFLGGPAGVSPGQKYLPDELAREIVTKHDLRKGVAISKQAIQDHLETVGVSMGLTTDVAMVLRNVYGVTPMFYEDNENLIAELGGVLNEGFPMPFREDPPEVLSEDDCFRLAIEDAFCEAETTEGEEMVAYLSTLSLEDVEAIAHLEDHLSEDQMVMLEAAYDFGGNVLGEACIDLLARPHMFVFAEDQILESLEAVCESRYLAEDARTMLSIKAKTGADKPKPGTLGHAEMQKKKFPRAHAMLEPNKKQQRRAAAGAELAKRKAAGTGPKGDAFHKEISQRGKGEMLGLHTRARGGMDDVMGKKSQRKHGEMITRSKIDREKAKMDGTHKGLPADVKKKSPGLMKRGADLINNFRSKVKGKVSDTIAGMKQKSADRKSAADQPKPEKKPGVFARMASKAKEVVGRVAGRVGDHVKASARARAPRLTHMAIGKEKAGEAEARGVRQGAMDTAAKVKQARGDAKAAATGTRDAAKEAAKAKIKAHMDNRPGAEAEA